MGNEIDTVQQGVGWGGSLSAPGTVMAVAGFSNTDGSLYHF